jgi:hypothetical protein
MKFYIFKNIIIQKHIVNENLSTKLVLIITGRITGLLIYHPNIILFQAFSRTLEQLVFSPSLSHHTPMAIRLKFDFEDQLLSSQAQQHSQSNT